MASGKDVLDIRYCLRVLVSHWLSRTHVYVNCRTRTWGELLCRSVFPVYSKSACPWVFYMIMKGSSSKYVSDCVLQFSMVARRCPTSVWTAASCPSRVPACTSTCQSSSCCASTRSCFSWQSTPCGNPSSSRGRLGSKESPPDTIGWARLNSNREKLRPYQHTRSFLIWCIAIYSCSSGKFPNSPWYWES